MDIHGQQKFSSEDNVAVCQLVAYSVMLDHAYIRTHLTCERLTLHMPSYTRHTKVCHSEIGKLFWIHTQSVLMQGVEARHFMHPDHHVMNNDVVP